jgi:hypothetical protein
MGGEDVLAQGPGIPVADMIDPALDARIQFGKADLPRLVQVEVTPQAQGDAFLSL